MGILCSVRILGRTRVDSNHDHPPYKGGLFQVKLQVHMVREPLQVGISRSDLEVFLGVRVQP